MLVVPRRLHHPVTKGAFTLGALELVIVLIVLIGVLLAPLAIVGAVARSRNRSLHYMWWPAFLSWMGTIIALVLILVQSEREPAARE